MLWLAELLGRVVWHEADGGVQFVAAMVTVSMHVVVLARVATRLRTVLERRLQR